MKNVKTILLLALILCVIASVSAAEKANDLSSLLPKDGVFPDGIQFGQSMQEARDKSSWEFVSEEEKFSIQYKVPAIEACTQTNASLFFFKGALQNIEYTLGYATADNRLSAFPTVLNELTALFGEPKARESVEYSAGIITGEDVLEDERYEYLWETGWNCYITLRTSESGTVIIFEYFNPAAIAADPNKEMQKLITSPESEGSAFPALNKPFFYGITFGMDKDSVLSLEKGTPAEGKDYGEAAFVRKDFLGYDEVTVAYSFTNKTELLYSVKYYFPVSNMKKSVNNYKTLNTCIEEIYGADLSDVNEQMKGKNGKELSADNLAKEIKAKNLSLSLFQFNYAFNYTIYHFIGTGGMDGDENVHHVFTITDGRTMMPYISMEEVMARKQAKASSPKHEGINKDEFVENYRGGIRILESEGNLKYENTLEPLVMPQEDEGYMLNFFRGEGMMVGFTFPYSDILSKASYVYEATDKDQGSEALIFLSCFMEGDTASERISLANYLVAEASTKVTDGMVIGIQRGHYHFAILTSNGQMILTFEHQDLSSDSGTLSVNDTNTTDEEAQSKDSTVLSSGEYDVGKHIDSGEYKVVPVKSAIIHVYRNGDMKISEYLNTKDMDEIGRLVLNAGDKIEISGGKLEFIPIE